MPLGKNGQVARLTARMAGPDWVVGVSEGAEQEESRYRDFYAQWGLSSSEEETVTVPPQSSTSTTLSCKPGSKIRQNHGCEMEKEEGGKGAWTDWVCTHFYLHPELHNSCSEV